MNFSNVKGISCEQLRELIGRRSLDIIDVRTPEEFRAAHAAGARNLPLDELDPRAVLDARSRSGEPLYVICQVGGRSAVACAMLLAAGHTNVINVDGGTDF